MGLGHVSSPEEVAMLEIEAFVPPNAAEKRHI
jgi:hypothetical protein